MRQYQLPIQILTPTIKFTFVICLVGVWGEIAIKQGLIRRLGLAGNMTQLHEKQRLGKDLSIDYFIDLVYSGSF